MNAITHKSLTETERNRLTAALNANAHQDKAIFIGQADTSFIGFDQPGMRGTHPEEVSDAEVINAIKSVPCHY